jgi:hypothetical protein
VRGRGTVDDHADDVSPPRPARHTAQEHQLA